MRVKNETTWTPLLMYGRDLWVVKERQEGKIEACEMIILWKIEVVTKMHGIRSEV